MEVKSSGQIHREYIDNSYPKCLAEMLKVIQDYDKQNSQVEPAVENNEQIWADLKTIFQNLSAKYQDAYNKKVDQNIIDMENGKTSDQFVDDNGNYSSDEYIGLPNLAKGEVNFPFNPESPFVIDYIEFVVDPESKNYPNCGNNEFNCPIFFKIRNTQTSYAINIDEQSKYSILAARFYNDIGNMSHGKIEFFSKEPIFCENHTVSPTFRKFAKIILEFGFAVE